MNWCDLIWHPDRMLFNGLVFRLEHYKSDDWDLGEDCFQFFKIQHLVDQYQRFWAGYQGPKPANILELGMFDGGSLAFWNEVFQPQKIVGVDIRKREDSPYFRRYVSSRGLDGRVKSYWGVSQDDAAALTRIVDDEFGGRVDLVIDDCSHYYAETKASFNILFPRLKSPGLYLIEDWAWGHWEEFQTSTSPWAKRTALTKLVFELVEVVGSSRPESRPPLISHVDIHQGFAAVHTGSATRDASQPLRLNDWVLRGPSVQQFFQERSESQPSTIRQRLASLFRSRA